MGVKGSVRRVIVVAVVIVMVLIVSILTALTNPSLFGWFRDDLPPHAGTFDLTGFRFYADRQLVLSDDGSGFNSTVRNEFNQSELLLVVEIKNTSVRWVQRYVYKYYNGIDFIETEKDNSTYMLFEDWEYDTVYTYSITFVCDATSEAVSSHSLFDESRYCGGSFVARDRRSDRVEFSDVGGLYSEQARDISIAYFGDPEAYGRISEYDLLIKIEGEGIATAA